jgi:hypothetical protein
VWRAVAALVPDGLKWSVEMTEQDIAGLEGSLSELLSKILRIEDQL